jgi:twinkle protein
MKIQSSNTRQIYQFEPTNGNRYICPECSHLRKPEHRNEKVLAWDDTNKRGYCHNCNSAFFEYRPYEQKQYVLPKWKNITALTDHAVKWFTGRMISQDTLVKMKIYSDNIYMPQFKKETEVICFPYFLEKKLVNIKYRGANKTFKLVSGAELIFWNINCISEHDEIIITEGEIDALTFVEAGFNNVISVPNGANKNLEYLDEYIELFTPIKKIYLATDQDSKGIELRDELARRLGAERCYVVNFKDCKDANEYLCKYFDKFKDLLKEAKPMPVVGIIEAEHIYNDILNYFNDGVQSGKKIEIFDIDKYITWETGRLAVVTGIPSSGKSEMVDYIIVKLNLLYRWKAAYFTPENYPLKFHYSKLYEKLIGKKFNIKTSNEVEYDLAYEHIKNNFYYILDEEDFTVKSILKNAKILVRTKGIKILVIDPYNRLDHKYSDSETQYISRFLDELINFAKFNDVLVFLVAHPRKMNRDSSGRIEVPTLYDISGSAHFYNKADYGFTVHRKVNELNIMINEVNIYWQKIKYRHLGEQGITKLRYNINNGRFDDFEKWDNSNWLANDNVVNLDLWIEREVPF